MNTAAQMLGFGGDYLRQAREQQLQRAGIESKELRPVKLLPFSFDFSGFILIHNKKIKDQISFFFSIDR